MNVQAETSVMPSVERIRLESVRRHLVVAARETLSPRMLRITLTGEELDGFHSPSPDDHVKVFFPTPNGEKEGRDYTPRRFNAALRSLDLDFVLHDGGVGATWARHAQPGDLLEIGGPRGSMVVSAPGAWWLLIGDETALPSVARRLEEFAPGTRVTALLCVEEAGDQPNLATSATLDVRWIRRPTAQAAHAQPVLDEVRKLSLPAGPGFVWIAAEAGVSRAVRDCVVEELGHPAEYLKASAYWTKAST